MEAAAADGLARIADDAGPEPLLVHALLGRRLGLRVERSRDHVLRGGLAHDVVELCELEVDIVLDAVISVFKVLYDLRPLLIFHYNHVIDAMVHIFWLRILASSLIGEFFEDLIM